MPVTESRPVPPPAEEARPDTSTGSRPTAAQPEHVDLSDAQLAWVFKRGFVFGTPVLYLVVAGLCMVAAPGHGWLLLAAVWPSLFAGWFFGGVVALSVQEWRQQGPRRATIASRAKRHATPYARRTPAPAH
jgi:hypothetical protein